MKRIAIFASGSGSNAENITCYFKQSSVAHVQLILTNNAQAGVIARAHNLQVHCIVFSNDDLKQEGKILSLLQLHKTDYVVLAGFLKLMPGDIIHAYKGRIINIHPSLLPKFGGKGMYGMRVHESVINAGEKESGITIHHVNERFDEGEIILQAKVSVNENETAESLANKIHELEYLHFPKVIEQLISQ
jgi:phosphoribosylglycinamide formyltransferase-1